MSQLFVEVSVGKNLFVLPGFCGHLPLQFNSTSEGSAIKADADSGLLFLQARVEANSIKITFTFEGKNLPSSLLHVLH